MSAYIDFKRRLDAGQTIFRASTVQVLITEMDALQNRAVRVDKLLAAVSFYARRYHNEHHQTNKLEDCTSNICQYAMRLMKTP